MEHDTVRLVPELALHIRVGTRPWRASGPSPGSRPGAASGSGPRPAVARPVPRRPTPKGRGRHTGPWIVAIASVLLAGAGVGGVVLWRGLPASRLIAAAKAEDTAKVRQLLAKGTDPNAADREGRTALFAAAGHDHVEIATLLLEKGADAGIVDKSGETPLHLAAMVDGATVAALLIQKGADPNVQDGEGFTP
ncbi:MAG: hypothetical protein FJX75_23400, partial [Armatimonadetes bacterium]|nr:hypothetical protein [Armatimonadota bacterium]